MFSLIRTAAFAFFGGIAALFGFISLFTSTGWVFFVALGVLIAVVSPWQKRWQQREREYQEALRTLNRPR